MRKFALRVGFFLNVDQGHFEAVGRRHRRTQTTNHLHHALVAVLFSPEHVYFCHEKFDFRAGFLHQALNQRVGLVAKSLAYRVKKDQN